MKGHYPLFCLTMLLADHKVLSLNDIEVLPDFSASRSLIVLMSLAQLVVILDMLFTFGISIDWLYLGLASFYVQWQAVLSALLLSFLKSRISQLEARKALWLAYMALLLLAFALSLAVEWLLPFLRANDQTALDWSFIIKNTLISGLLIGVALHYMYLQKCLLVKHKAQSHAKLMTLQAKIKPHFLFNCLNSIAQLIHKEPERAEDMVVDLSELLRASLHEGTLETSVAEEWTLCEHYLQIEATRLQKRLAWSSDFSKLDTRLGMLSLSLQPLVENAIYHGIQPEPDGGKIFVSGINEGTKVTLTVENTQTASAFRPKSSTGHQMALDNIRQRLTHLYGAGASVLQESAGDLYRVTLTYDVSEKANA